MERCAERVGRHMKASHHAFCCALPLLFLLFSCPYVFSVQHDVIPRRIHRFASVDMSAMSMVEMSVDDDVDEQAWDIEECQNGEEYLDLAARTALYDRLTQDAQTCPFPGPHPLPPAAHTSLVQHKSEDGTRVAVRWTRDEVDQLILIAAMPPSAVDDGEQVVPAERVFRELLRMEQHHIEFDNIEQSIYAMRVRKNTVALQHRALHDNIMIRQQETTDSAHFQIH